MTKEERRAALTKHIATAKATHERIIDDACESGGRDELAALQASVEHIQALGRLLLHAELQDA
jgi:hypothetical protein